MVRGLGLALGLELGLALELVRGLDVGQVLQGQVLQDLVQVPVQGHQGQVRALVQRPELVPGQVLALVLALVQVLDLDRALVRVLALGLALALDKDQGKDKG